MSYTIESFTEKVIHNANEKIVVGVNNNQVITGNKRFANVNDSNIPSSGRIEIGTTIASNKAKALLSIYADNSINEAGVYCPHGTFNINHVKFTNNKIRPEGSSYSISLGESSIRWNTLYCDNLSDGTTTKTMTDVLANSVAKYRHMIKLKFKVGELGEIDPTIVYGTVNLD